MEQTEIEIHCSPVQQYIQGRKLQFDWEALSRIGDPREVVSGGIQLPPKQVAIVRAADTFFLAT